MQPNVSVRHDQRQPSEDVDFDSEVPLLIIGAGAAGLCAALAASEAGVEPVVIERDAVPAGRRRCRPASSRRRARASSASGASRIRRSASPQTFPARRTARRTRSWCRPSQRAQGRRSNGWRMHTRMPFEVITDFNYPGHSAHRMHGLPSRTGAELIDRLRSAAEARDIPILTGRVCRDAVRRRGRLHRRRRDHAARARPSAAARWCSPATATAAIPSWCGGTSPRWPTRSISAIRAIRAMPCCGARRSARGVASLSGYQGHGSVATPHNILITWAAITEGGFQVNAQGRRFPTRRSAIRKRRREVLRQPGGIAFDIFDARIAGVARQFEDFRNAEKAGALITARHDR